MKIAMQLAKMVGAAVACALAYVGLLAILAPLFGGEPLGAQVPWVDATDNPVQAEAVSSCKVIENIAATDDDKMIPASMGQAITITAGYCTCQGLCGVPPQIDFEIVDVGPGTVAAITGTVTCSTLTDTPAKTSLTASVPALNLLRFDTSNTPTGCDECAVCIDYTTN